MSRSNRGYRCAPLLIGLALVVLLLIPASALATGWVSGAVVSGVAPGSSATGSQGWTPVTFTVTAGPWNVNIRGDSNTNSSIIGNLAPNTSVSCCGWEDGQSIANAWSGAPDQRWYLIGTWPPAGGSFVQVSGLATIYAIAGGAPLAVSNWGAVGGAQPYSVVSQAQFNSLPSTPANGTFVNARTASGTEEGSFVIAGGAPVYISTWSVYGGAPAGVVSIDYWDLQNITNSAAHLNAVPANGTFLNTSTGAVYRVAGGAPIAVSTWSLFGGVQPYVTIDQWDINNIANPAAHLNAKPANGTLVEGLPSRSYWSFSGGRRRPAGASGAAVKVDDVGLGAFPFSDVTPPTVKISGAANGSWHRHSVTVTLKAADNAGGFGLKSITYRLGDAAPVSVQAASASVTISAPADHTNDGKHTLSYYATDLAGNHSTKKTFLVGIDTTAPTPSALGTLKRSCRKGATIKVPYKIGDSRTGCGKVRVTVVFYRIPLRGAAVYVTQRALGVRLANHRFSYAFHCVLAKGYYLYMVKATDVAGNVSATSLHYGDPVFIRTCRQLKVT